MPPLSQSERHGFAAAAGTAAVMIAQQVAAKATRDALFLAAYPAERLPLAMLTGALVSLTAALAFGKLVGRLGPVRVLPTAFSVSAGLFALEWALDRVAHGPVVWLVYIHVAAFGALLISGFWSIYNERFDPNLAKRLIGKVGAGATLGGVAGGVASERLSSTVDVASTLLLLAVLNVLCAAGVVVLGRGHPSPEVASTESGLRLLRRSPYLARIAILVTLTAFSTELIEFALKARADGEIATELGLMQFFAAFYAATSLATFIVQFLLTQGLLARLGLAGTLALLPAGMLVLSVLGTAVTRLWSVALLRGVGSVAENSLYRSAYELLYTPLPATQKRAVKTLIDVAVDRSGEALGGLAVLAAVAVSPALAAKAAVGVAVLASLAALATAWRLHGGYVNALAESLRAGIVGLKESAIIDATTRKTFNDTTAALDRERLLEEIRKLRADQDRAAADVRTPDLRTSRYPQSVRQGLHDTLRDLLSDDPVAVDRALSGTRAARPELGPLLINLLGDRRFEKASQTALESMAQRIIGQLHDALLDRSQSRAVRKRVATVLEHCPTPRSVAALLDGLSEPHFEIRYRCGQALAVLHRRGVVQIDRDRVHELVLSELGGSAGFEESDEPSSEDEAGEPGWLEGLARRRMHRKLEHGFSLLSLTYDARALALSLKALLGDDPTLRGTALEYLDNILPEDVKAALWPHLGAEGSVRPSRRQQQELLDELLKTADSVALDPSLLRGRS